MNNQFYLMHKDIVVGAMLLTDEGNILKVNRNPNTSNHFPVGGQMNDIKFREWWNDRAIPKTRHGAKSALQKLGFSSTNSALINNLALSLNDCYWIKPFNTDLVWNDVSLFKNDFVDTFGSLTFNSDNKYDLKNKTRFYSATSQGELRKKWCIDENRRRFLVKGNYGDSYQQSINEVFACKLYEQVGFNNCLKYELVDLKTVTGTDGIGCLSYNYCSDEIESISAWEYLQTRKIRENESLYWPLKEICLELGMNEQYFDNYLDYQIMVDFLITNTDRHMNNISILRNPDTLEILGFAPIYDNGNSMFYNTPFEKLSSIDFSKIETHSFIKHEIKLLSYVTNRKRIDLSKIKPDFTLYENDTVERRMRIEKIESLFNRKLELLKSFQNGNDIWSYNYIKTHFK